MSARRGAVLQAHADFVLLTIRDTLPSDRTIKPLHAQNFRFEIQGEWDFGDLGALTESFQLSYALYA